MPTYDYECDACGHRFEEFQSMTAPVLKKCPQCGKNKIRRLIGIGAGVIFKGSGFYCTDYRDKTYTAAAKKDKEGASGAKPDAAAKTESKPGEAKSGDAKPAESKPAPSESKKSTQHSRKS